ncbi:MAG: CRTAC1 family protein [Planctomycetota bacterium]|jgi:hypothetical protein
MACRIPSPRSSPAVRLLGALLATALAPACGDDGRPLFEERAQRAGLDIVLTCGEPGAKQTILEVNGNGVALADLDGDGDLDVVLVDGSTRARLVAGETVRHHVLRNVGPQGGLPRFEPTGDEAGLFQEGWPTGIATGDVDRDGRVDLLIGGVGEDALFLNRTEPGGPLRFEKQALPGRTSPRDWTTSVALADADGDGLLDAYLVRYLEIDPADPPLGDVGGVPCEYAGIPVMCGPHGLPPQADVMLRGLDRPPWFEDATDQSGIRAAPPRYGLGVLFMDLDADGRPDVYVANDSVPNTLLRNLGGGRFEDVSALSGAASDLAGRDQAGMGVDAGDMDGDGDFEIVVTNFSDESNAVYRNDGRMLFRDVATAAGLAQSSRTMLGWGVHLADLDADGDLDLYVSNGHVFPQADLPGMNSAYAQPQQLYLGDGRGGLLETPFPDSRAIRGRASARGDLDGDGDLDLITLTLDGAPLLYVNRTDAPERQLLVSLTQGGAPVPTAVLRVETAHGPRVGQVLSSTGFQSASDPHVHFANVTGMREATVHWPDGSLESLDVSQMMSGRRVRVERGRGIVSSDPLVRASEHSP